MRVCFELFQSLGKPWNTLCEEAAEFASKIPPGRLISIAHSEDQDDAVLTVWYWQEPEAVVPAPPAISKATASRVEEPAKPSAGSQARKRKR
jgi:hypothetical protein